jgi:hypothetical protein
MKSQRKGSYGSSSSHEWQMLCSPAPSLVRDTWWIAPASCNPANITPFGLLRSTCCRISGGFRLNINAVRSLQARLGIFAFLPGLGLGWAYREIGNKTRIQYYNIQVGQPFFGKKISYYLSQLRGGQSRISETP